MTTTHYFRPAAVVIAAAAIAMSATAASAEPPANGCPSGFEVLAVAELAPQGYQVPGIVDDPNSGLNSFGRPGNGNGLVCAVPLGNRTTPWGGAIYNFLDDNLLS